MNPWRFTPAGLAARVRRFGWDDREVNQEAEDALNELVALADQRDMAVAVLEEIWQRRESWYDAMGDDEAGLPWNREEEYWDMARDGLDRIREHKHEHEFTENLPNHEVRCGSCGEVVAGCSSCVA